MTQRPELEDRLERLYRDAGAAKLDGKRFDYGKITQAENELRVVDAADAERVRRQREQATKDFMSERNRNMRRLCKLEDGRLLAWADLQVACATLREAIGRVVQNSETERVIWGEVAPATPPALAPYEVHMRVGLRIANELSKAPGCKSRIGGAVQWSAVGGLLSGDEDWRESEAKLVEIPIKALEDEIRIQTADETTD